VSFVVVYVVVADQMQDTVNQESDHSFIERPMHIGRLSGSCFDADDNISEHATTMVGMISLDE